ncbi:MAG: hypothetical protein E7627_08800 [Ruminococcaceae bacterium]|nr:hypothetical protein [Oscillospiraceae bacterium]
MIFDENCNLCDEVDVLASVREAHDLLSLRHELFSSLGKNLRAFQEFCEIRSAESAGDYRIFKLKRRFGNYLYLYCEKNIISGAVANMVFPAEDQSDFYSFLSPSSGYFRTITDRIVYEILCLKNRNYYALTSVSPEAFLVMSRAPFLVETLLGDHTSARFCDILDVTRRTLESISANPSVSTSEITLESSNYGDSTPLIKLPVEAFAAVVQMAVVISVALSEDHRIDARVSRHEGFAEVKISTVTNRLNSALASCDICALENQLSPLGSYAKIASIIAHIAEFDADISFDAETKKLSVVIAAGLAKQPLPDFKFSDPSEHIRLVSEEANALLVELGTENCFNLPEE